ncbi:acetylornithine aminotransferase [Methylohalomonas lacus]|uniref:Acetylornithine aminotransferase n=1 Tax=Methylohalomonas lacus TaxID=398773 RepID=A0AAE3HJM9_9GAMM|nr:acetylornithine transaminase [Methylohalomonas lacus]MCS3903510.1 acetylornithine aminotransferase [Methylohalomonas lacus]
MSSLMTTYAQLDVAFERGAGAWLYDQHGEAYLDALSGIAVCGLGHAHPALAEALSAQAGRLVHTSNIYRIPLQEQLGEKLIDVAGMDRVFFCNSGAEANEAAIKLARLYGHQRDVSRPKIVVMENAFHGRTLATLSATGSVKVQKGFTPLVPGFVRVPYGDIEAVERAAAEYPDIVAVLVEPVQGEGGIHIPPADYLGSLRRLCDAHEWLLMLDEVQTGMGRTGQWFACQHEAITPDVMTLAKALGNGVPIGACLASGRAADLFQPGNHGSTFGGNPFAARAALTVIDTIAGDGLVARAAELGTRMLTGLQNALQDQPGVTAVRGHGLMIGVELDRPCQQLVTDALQQRLLINVTADKVIRLLPPLILSDDEADRIVAGVSDIVRQFLNQGT